MGATVRSASRASTVGKCRTFQRHARVSLTSSRHFGLKSKPSPRRQKCRRELRPGRRSPSSANCAPKSRQTAGAGCVHGGQRRTSDRHPHHHRRQAAAGRDPEPLCCGMSPIRQQERSQPTLQGAAFGFPDPLPARKAVTAQVVAGGAAVGVDFRTAIYRRPGSPCRSGDGRPHRDAPMRGATRVAEVFHKSADSAVRRHAHPEIESRSVTGDGPPRCRCIRLSDHRPGTGQGMGCPYRAPCAPTSRWA
jgi:hypothetical protein